MLEIKHRPFFSVIHIYRVIICNILGHAFKYNFQSMPNKRICKRCYKKEMWDKKPFVWDKTFIDARTDNELIGNWF